MKYDPLKLSQSISNSIANNNQGIKPGRLSKKGRSFQEAKSGYTKKGNKVHGRILIGTDDDANMILLDGRHLLHAYTLLRKSIPIRHLGFESYQTKVIFDSLFTP